MRNDGTAALVLGTVTLVGLNPDQFVVVAATNLCTGRTLAAGQSCTVLVRFKPTTAGFKTAKLRIPSNDPDEAAVKVNLNGTASGASRLPRSPSPGVSALRERSVGVKSIQVVTVKNDGAADLVLGATGLSTATSEIGLAAGQDLCSGVTLAPGQSCTIAVKIKATSSGPKTATLSIPSNDADESVVSVSVTATAPARSSASRHSLADRPPHALGAERHVEVAHAERAQGVHHGIDHGGGRADGGGLADALGAEGIAAASPSPSGPS